MTQPETGPLPGGQSTSAFSAPTSPDSSSLSAPAATAEAPLVPAPPAEPEPPARLPWYRDLRFAVGLFAAPFFFFAPAIIHLVAPDLSLEQAKQGAQAMQFISGAALLFPLAAVIEAVTDYYEHNFLHQHDRYNALLRAGLLHTSFTNFAFLVLTIFTLASAQQHGSSSIILVRIVQVSIAGAIVVSILFNLGISI
ncbi:MAG TPA: hypothetical protein VE258_05050, partial [Ktedonobacterales bacterium]|nr:hypothetical protein [Ktedonobacterales bacterium]